MSTAEIIGLGLICSTIGMTLVVLGIGHDIVSAIRDLKPRG